MNDGMDFSARHKINQLVISALSSDQVVLFTATDRGLFRRTDGGGHWQQVQGGDLKESSFIEAIALSPDYAKDGTYLASVRGVGLLRTRDDGRHFARIGKELDYLVAGSSNPTASPISFSPAYGEDRTIVCYSENKLLRSTNGGDSWRVISPFPEPIAPAIHSVDVTPFKWVLIVSLMLLTAALIARRVTQRRRVAKPG